eukprot:gene16432-18068_t
MDPIIDLMLRAQLHDTPIRMLKIWWPKVEEKLVKAENGNPLVFPRLKKVEDSLKPGGEFKRVKSLDGWLIAKDIGNDAAEKARYAWHLREDKDVKEDRKALAKELREALN